MRRILSNLSATVEPLEPRRLLNAIPVGSEFQVNTTTSGDQIRPSIATDVDGDFVVAWQGPDGRNTGVFAQRYNSAGIAQGGEFRVNSTTKGGGQPSSAMDADGDFVVAWRNGSAFARRYNAAGVAQGNEFRVNTTSGVGFPGPEVAMNASAGFVVAYAASTGHGNNVQTDVFSQRYDATGAPLGAELRVTNSTPAEGYVDVGMDGDGDFVVTWHHNDGSGLSVYARRYNSAGVAQGSQFLVNTSTTGDQFAPKVALDADGDFVVNWMSYQDGPSGQGALGIYGQRYNAAGVPQGGEFQVNTYTTDAQDWPDVSMDALGNFVVVWRSQGQDAPATAGIFGQCYDASGAPLGSEFQVNTYTTSHQAYPAVAMDATGDFVATWQSYQQDGSGRGIYAQRYAPAAPASASASPFGGAPGRGLFSERLLGLEQEDHLESILRF